ncbi:hypothetical protein WJX82_006626 [Trebouxia sp. C0006]
MKSTYQPESVDLIGIMQEVGQSLGFNVEYSRGRISVVATAAKSDFNSSFSQLRDAVQGANWQVDFTEKSLSVLKHMEMLAWRQGLLILNGMPMRARTCQKL